MGHRNGDASREKRTPLTSPEHMLPRSSRDLVEGGNETGERQKPGGLVRVRSGGESGRSGIHPWQFLTILWTSSSSISRAVNILWPFVPAALAVYFTGAGSPTLRFSLSYIAMVPCANMVGFAGAELARKMPHLLGVLTETTCVSSRNPQSPYLAWICIVS